MALKVSRPILVALVAALLFYLAADALKLNAASNAITFVFFGVVVAVIVEFVIAIVTKHTGAGENK
jgi:hypothetical protein